MVTGPESTSASSYEQLRLWMRSASPSLETPSDPAEIARWRPRLRRKLGSLLRLDSLTPAPPSVTVVRKRAHGKLNVYDLLISPEGDLAWPALIIEPMGAASRRPAWVCLHGHIEGGMSAVTGLVVDRPGGAESLERFKCDYGLRLAEMGHVTISFDFPGFGPRLGAELPKKDVKESLGIMAMDIGKTMPGWQVSDTMAAMSVLAAWPTVDAGKLGVIGFSMGARIGSFFATLDRRISFAVFSGRTDDIRVRYDQGKNITAYGAVPGFLKYMDREDVFASFAPKLMLINQEVRGDLPVAVSQTEKITRAYAALNAPDKLTILFDAPDPPQHRFPGPPIYEWIERNLPILTE